MQLCERKHNIIHNLHSYCGIHLILISFLYFVVWPVFVFLLCICCLCRLCQSSPASWWFQSRLFLATSADLWASINIKPSDGDCGVCGGVYYLQFDCQHAYGGFWENIFWWPFHWRCLSGIFQLCSRRTFHCQRRTLTEPDRPSCRTRWWLVH